MKSVGDGVPLPTRRAFALLGLASLLSIFGFATPWLGAVALLFDLGILALAWYDGRRAARAPLRVERELPRVLHQGEPATLGLVLENTASWPVRVHAREVLAPPLLAAPRDLHAEVPPRSSLRLPLELVPRRRGGAELAPVALRVQGPWGLGWARLQAAPGQRARVYPRAHLDGEAGLLLRHAIERRTGANPVQRRGISTELYALREYQAGDQLRSIHWKASARRQRPVTREDAWEQHQHVVVLVDCGRPMASLDQARPDGAELCKLDHAISTMLALLRVVVAQHDSATLVLYSKELRRVVRVDHRTRGFAQVFEAVHEVQADLEEPDHQAAVAWVQRHVPRRSLVLLCSSVVELASAERLSEALGVLARRHRPLLVNLEDPGLLAHARSIPDDVEGAFAKTSALGLAHANHALTTRLRSRGIDVVSAPASHLPLAVLQRYLDLKALRRA